MLASRSPQYVFSRAGQAFPALVLLALVSLSGCSNLRLHSDVRQKQGEAAVAAWKEVDLKPTFAQARDNNAKVLAIEIEAWNRRFDYTHESEVREFALLQLSAYSARFDTRLKTLIGAPTSEEAKVNRKLAATRTTARSVPEDAIGNLSEERDAQVSLADSYASLQLMGAPKFTCSQLTAPNREIVDAWKKANPAIAVTAGTKVDLATKSCQDIGSARDSFVDTIAMLPPTALLKQRLLDLGKAQSRLKLAQAAADGATIALNAAQDAYDRAVLDLSNGTSSKKAVEDKAKDIRNKIDALASVAGALGIQLASEERIKRIDDLLASIGEGKELTSDSASKLEIALSMLPELAGDKDAINAASLQSALPPLLLKRDLERAKAATAAAIVARDRLDVELLSAEISTLTRQAWTYKLGQDLIDNVPMDSGVGNTNLAGALAALVSKELAAQSLQKGMALYLDAFTRQEKQLKALQLKRLALWHDAPIDLSEVNASVWVALINVSVAQAAEYTTLGIKAEDIKDILGLVGLGYIGHGANK